jgi:Uma2 family endonuclease
MSVPLSPPHDIVYPDSDGLPMSENTLQYEWIVAVRWGLDVLFADRRDVFVAADLLWYPVEGRPDIRLAPDVMVVFGRPNGYRGSYQQWKEDGIAPQVVFEVLSPGNRPGEMDFKLRFYDDYGFKEYYVINPYELTVAALRRGDTDLESVTDLATWRSPLLGIRFDQAGAALRILGPDSRPFATYDEIVRLPQQVDQQRQRAEQERQVKEAAQAEVERLKARLRDLGQDPDA